MSFLAQTLGEMQGDGLIVQVAAEVRNMHLNGLMGVADGRVRADVNQRRYAGISQTWLMETA